MPKIATSRRDWAVTFLLVPWLFCLGLGGLLRTENASVSDLWAPAPVVVEKPAPPAAAEPQSPREPAPPPVPPKAVSRPPRRIEERPLLLPPSSRVKVRPEAGP
jgi:hypothetical protein